MPSYPEFFDGTPTRPRQEALDLVAYLNTLGRSRELAWPEGEIAMRQAAGDDQWTLMSLDADQLNAHPARTAPWQRPQPAGSGTCPRRPQAVGTNCEGCHGEDGAGDGLPQPGCSRRRST